MINKVYTFLKSEYFIFVITRVIIVLIKPLFLWMCIDNDLQHTSKLLAIWFLVVSSVMVLFNNEAHFYFYKYLFGKESKYKIVKSEIAYYQAMAIHILLFSVPVFIITYFVSGSIILSSIFFVILILDKVFDEVQRIKQFEKRFLDWSKMMLIKAFLPYLISILILLFSQQDHVILYLYFILYTLFTVIALTLYTKWKHWKIGVSSILKISKEGIVKYLKIYKEKLVFNQMQSFSSRNVSLADRYLIRFSAPALLPIFTLISQLGSFSVLFIDYFLISHRRNEYIKWAKNVKAIVPFYQLLLYGVSSFLILVSVITVGQFFGFIEGVLPIGQFYIYLVCLYFALFAISMHFNQFNFWNRERKYTLLIDGVFYSGVILGFMFIPFDVLIEKVIIIMLISHTLRLMLMVILSLLKDDKYVYHG